MQIVLKNIAYYCKMRGITKEFLILKSGMEEARLNDLMEDCDDATPEEVACLCDSLGVPMSFFEADPFIVPEKSYEEVNNKEPVKAITVLNYPRSAHAAGIHRGKLLDEGYIVATATLNYVEDNTKVIDKIISIVDEVHIIGDENVTEEFSTAIKKILKANKRVVIVPDIDE